MPSEQLKLCLNTYNQDSTTELRAALGNNHTFLLDYNKESFDKDWINLVVIHSFESMKMIIWTDITPNNGINRVFGQ